MILSVSSFYDLIKLFHRIIIRAFALSFFGTLAKQSIYLLNYLKPFSFISRCTIRWLFSVSIIIFLVYCCLIFPKSILSIHFHSVIVSFGFVPFFLCVWFLIFPSVGLLPLRVNSPPLMRFGIGNDICWAVWPIQLLPQTKFSLTYFYSKCHKQR